MRTLRSTFTRLHAPELTSDEAQYLAKWTDFLGDRFSTYEMARMMVVRRACLAGYYSDSIDGATTTEWSCGVEMFKS